MHHLSGSQYSVLHTDGIIIINGITTRTVLKKERLFINEQCIICSIGACMTTVAAEWTAYGASISVT